MAEITFIPLYIILDNIGTCLRQAGTPDILRKSGASEVTNETLKFKKSSSVKFIGSYSVKFYNVHAGWNISHWNIRFIQI